MEIEQPFPIMHWGPRVRLFTHPQQQLMEESKTGISYGTLGRTEEVVCGRSARGGRMYRFKVQSHSEALWSKVRATGPSQQLSGLCCIIPQLLSKPLL